MDQPQRTIGALTELNLSQNRKRVWPLKSMIFEGSKLISITKVPLAVIILLLIDIGLFSAYLTNYMIGKPSRSLTALLSLNHEFSIATWYSSTKLFCISVLTGLFGYRHFNWKEKRSWLIVLLSLLFLFISMDEALSIHEWLGHKIDSFLSYGDGTLMFFRHTGISMFIFAIPFFIFYLLLLFLIRNYFSDKTGSFKKVLFGMFILLISVLGFKTLSNFPSGNTSLTYHFIIGCEETFEMIGGTIILWGFYDLVKDLIVIEES